MTMNGDFNIAFVADIDEAHYMDFWVLMRRKWFVGWDDACKIF